MIWEVTFEIKVAVYRIIVYFQLKVFGQKHFHRLWVNKTDWFENNFFIVLVESDGV